MTKIESNRIADLLEDAASDEELWAAYTHFFADDDFLDYTQSVQVAMNKAASFIRNRYDELD